MDNNTNLEYGCSRARRLRHKLRRAFVAALDVNINTMREHGYNPSDPEYVNPWDDPQPVTQFNPWSKANPRLTYAQEKCDDQSHSSTIDAIGTKALIAELQKMVEDESNDEEGRRHEQHADLAPALQQKSAGKGDDESIDAVVHRVNHKVLLDRKLFIALNVVFGFILSI